MVEKKGVFIGLDSERIKAINHIRILKTLLNCNKNDET